MKRIGSTCFVQIDGCKNCCSCWRRDDDEKCIKCGDLFREYCDNTTIHGFKYLGEKKKSWIEKLWWILLLTVCFAYCYVLTAKTYAKWQKSPILIGVRQNPVPVWQIPFPAVTLCPQIKSKATVCNYTALHNDWRNRKQLSTEEMEILETLTMVCAQPGPSSDRYALNETVLDLLAEVAPSMDYMKTECGWRQNNTVDCSQLLTPVFTFDGLCYTFNSLDRKDMYTEAVSHYENFGQINRSIKGWDYERGYDNRLGIRTYPRRDLHLSRKHVEQSGFLMRAGLHRDDLDYACTGTDLGFKVFLHHPAETIRHGQQFFFVPLTQIAEIIVEPRMMTTSDDLRDYDPQRRRCYYQHEKPLTLFKTYTKANCETECAANFTYTSLGCVPFYMPRQSNWSICGSIPLTLVDMLKDLGVAMKEAYEYDFDYYHMGMLISRDLQTTFTSFVKNAKALDNATFSEGLEEIAADDFEEDMQQFQDVEFSRLFHCDCLPACTSVDYFGRKSLKDYNWNWEHRMVVDRGDGTNASQYEGMIFSRVNVIYADNRVLASERTELFGTEDFIGNIGGLLGLFTGFSFLSAFEIIYYLSLRPWCNRKRRTANNETNE